ncbi:MAG TPA: type II toxin-antitoxin system VapC family toxin [Candidatus Cloacimonetes bacterium]|nr:type II toxin-antitoxin system VapC family toxin [Candidatus Cloacimonadota bacterium]
MKNSLLIDTDILVDYLRGEKQAISFLENLEQKLVLSSVNVAELYSGVRKGKEEEILKIFLQAFEIIPVTDELAIKGGFFRRDFLKSHGIGLADAIVAATAEMFHCELTTLNRKHYPMIKDVFVPYRKRKP